MSNQTGTETTMTAVSDAITAAGRTLDSVAENTGIPADVLRDELTNPDTLHWITVLRVADELGISVIDLLPSGVAA